MDERDYLVKAQEAEAFANAAETQQARLAWDRIAREYRRLAAAVTALRREKLSNPE